MNNKQNFLLAQNIIFFYEVKIYFLVGSLKMFDVTMNVIIIFWLCLSPKWHKVKINNSKNNGRFGKHFKLLHLLKYFEVENKQFCLTNKNF